jgi:hypothetical protein
LLVRRRLRPSVFGDAPPNSSASGVLPSAIEALPAHDPVTVIALALALIAVALFAYWLPPRRPAALDPMVALR